MTEWKGQFSGALQGARKVIRSAADWRSSWAAIGQEAPTAPDFKTHFAVAVLLGERRTGGYRVQWLGVGPAGGATVVKYKEMKPEGMALQAVTQPYAVKVFPLEGGDIRVEEAED
ncbi:MAG: protease complex subunit PrcB family protein [Elusimicrobia bacterium]|nr:protease complex subunit PrcB family protein [Elusimicrobiota bacterium]